MREREQERGRENEERKDDVCIIIPTLNEEATIGEVVRGFKEQGFRNILVIDGHSTDRTREIAESAGAKVVVQEGKGKGAAVQQAFKIADARIFVLIDGDGTYEPSEVERLLEPIFSGEAEHVIGNRFAYGGHFTLIHRIGNFALNKLFAFAYGVKLNDILSGYRALSRELVEEMELAKEGFEIEAEMTIETVKKGFRIAEVPIKYGKRKGRSKLHTFRDGSKIAFTLYELVKTHNPLFYFGIIGLLFIIIGIISGIYVVMEWLKGISHTLLTVFTSLMIISGVQIMIFGMLADLIVSLQNKTIEELRRQRREMAKKNEKHVAGDIRVESASSRRARSAREEEE